MSLRDQILAASDSQFDTVEVPEWNCAIRVRSMNGAERDALERRISDQGKLGTLGTNIRAMMVAFCAVDDAGARLFMDADIEALGAKNWVALDRVATAAMRLNKLQASDVEAEVKN